MAKETFTSKDNIKKTLRAEGTNNQYLHSRAGRVRDRHVGRKVYFRGLIEFSNICNNDCFYCGLRKSNSPLKRYTMSKKEILDCARMCKKAGFSSLVLQSGERKDKQFIDFVTLIVKSIKKNLPSLGITLCVGEQKLETYKKFYDAGAHRYLLRIESSDSEHYQKLHPKKMIFEERKKCLENLRNIGYQTGTGIMIGAPFQSIDNLASDLMFIKESDVDMVGMGPYIPHKDSPLVMDNYDKNLVLTRSLNMISILRIMMPDINIAATTALQTLDTEGREKGLKAGANIIMPVITPQKYRASYVLYDNRPCIFETASQCSKCIIKRVKSTGLQPVKGKWGDSPRFFKRKKKEKNGCSR